MHLGKRDLLRAVAAAAAAGLPLARHAEADAARAQHGLYDLPRFGNVSLLHMTDCHAQLSPLHFREPAMNLGVGAMRNQWPHLVGEPLLRAAGLRPGTAHAHAIGSLDFERLARRYGRMGGFAALATLVRQLRASRPGALLLDGGDTWQGSATALWTQGRDMIAATRLLGVDVMTAHWEFTYGMDRLRQALADDLGGRTAFVAQNVATADFGDPVFESHVLREVAGVPVAIIGQAFPYTPIAHPRRLVADWTFGIQEERLQALVSRLRQAGAQVVVLLSHNGMDVDLKLASRVQGLDAIFGGHTHDAVPLALPVANAGGRTLVTNAGSHGKFLGVMDFDVRRGRIVGHRYRLLPVFADQLVPDADMAALIERVRAPHAARLAEPLAVTDGLLFRRGNFNGSWDQLVCDALRDRLDAPIALSPGFRFGGTLLPGDTVTREALMSQVAIPYPETSVREMTGAELKAVLEDVADNLFNPDPYRQQGGDMVRSAGLRYRLRPGAAMGERIDDLRIGDAPLQADRHYKVAGWASVAEPPPSGPPVWDVVESWLKSRPEGRVAAAKPDAPQLVGEDDNLGRGA